MDRCASHSPTIPTAGLDEELHLLLGELAASDLFVNVSNVLEPPASAGPGLVDGDLRRAAHVLSPALDAM